MIIVEMLMVQMYTLTLSPMMCAVHDNCVRYWNKPEQRAKLTYDSPLKKLKIIPECNY